MPRVLHYRLRGLPEHRLERLHEEFDVLAEVRTRKFDTLTYAHSAAEAEDISLFERRRKRNIASYASKDKLAARGRFYNEDDLASYDVLDYDIEVAAQPERQWIEGRATMHLRVRANSLSQLNLRLADGRANNGRSHLVRHDKRVGLDQSQADCTEHCTTASTDRICYC